MHILAQRVVEQVLAAGATLDPLRDFDALDGLNRAALALAEPPAWQRAAALDWPVAAGNAELRRLSWAGWEWVEERARPWFLDDPSFLDLAVAWAMAHARDRKAFEAASTPWTTRRLVRRWLRGLDCSVEALLAAAESLLPAQEGTEDGRRKKGRPMGAGLVLARLRQEFGGEEEWWLWGAPFDTVRAALALLDEQAAAAARKDGDGSAVWEQRAFLVWSREAEEFRRKVEGGMGKAEGSAAGRLDEGAAGKVGLAEVPPSPARPVQVDDGGTGGDIFCAGGAAGPPRRADQEQRHGPAHEQPGVNGGQGVGGQRPGERQQNPGGHGEGQEEAGHA